MKAQSRLPKAKSLKWWNSIKVMDGLGCAERQPMRKVLFPLRTSSAHSTRMSNKSLEKNLPP